MQPRYIDRFNDQKTTIEKKLHDLTCDLGHTDKFWSKYGYAQASNYPVFQLPDKKGIKVMISKNEQNKVDLITYII
jgi:hypothetical protein